MNMTVVNPRGQEASPMPAIRRAQGLPLVEVSVHAQVAELEADWLDFQSRAAGTLYQSYHWCRTWQETVGAARGIQPRIVVGREAHGRISFILPFAIRRTHGIRVLEWLGGNQSGYGYGLYARGFLGRAAEWFACEGWRILDAAGPVDAIELADMPARWNSHPHPLSAWFSIKGPNVSYVMALDRCYEAIYAAKRSGATRRGNRKRDAKLAKEGALQFGLPATPLETHRLLDEMFAQQSSRLGESGIRGVFEESERAFIHRLADLPSGPILLPYHLSIDGELIAMMLGGHFGGGYWALISSLAARSRRYSPGDAALRQTIGACCQRGLSFFDFAAGDSAYKLHWADERISLYYGIRGLTLKGYAWAAMRMAAISAKRAVKRSPLLWDVARAARATFYAKVRPLSEPAG